MKNQFKRSLGRIASIEYQRRYCANGTKEEYVLPHELLDSAAGLAQRLLDSSSLSKEFSGVEIASLRRFLELVDSEVEGIQFDLEPIQDLIDRDCGWVRVRDAARDTLGALGIQPSENDLK